MRTNHYGWLFLLCVAMAGGVLVNESRKPGDDVKTSAARPSQRAEPTSLEKGSTAPLTEDGPKRTARSNPALRTASPPPLAEQSEGALRAELSELERELEDAHAIERLNAEEVEPDERAALGQVLERTAMVRNAIAERELEALGERVEAYARSHPARVDRFVRGGDEKH